jgi:hypothetical protein
MQKELLTKKDYRKVGEEISHELAADFIRSYHQKFEGDTVSYGIGKEIIEQILAQPGCAGLRFYNALNEDGKKTLVYVGVDATGKDIIKRTVVQAEGVLSTENAIVADRSTDPSPSPSSGLWAWIWGS